ncbi:MAG TPA: hypothetical protein VK673_21365 [Chthoniobacterales bacterium]|nr:hypothetical protein [Chthoniobacterales bacterium]
MILPEKIKQRYIDKLESLISEGSEIAGSIRIVQERTERGYRPAKAVYDHERLSKWRTNCIILLEPFRREGSKLTERIDHISEARALEGDIKTCVGILQGFRQTIEERFLDDLFLRVESEIAADYMGQAEQLLKEGQSGKFDHVPAAVLSGAVLEKGLKTLCGQQQSPVSITDAKGAPKTLNPLIDDLKKAGAFSELKAKQLRAWAAIRNEAAHGEFNAFTRADVEQMVHGIQNFLAEYLG